MTAAFSDLIIKQNEILMKNLKMEAGKMEPEMPKKAPLSTKTPEGEEEDFSEFEPRWSCSYKPLIQLVTTESNIFLWLKYSKESFGIFFE